MKIRARFVVDIDAVNYTEAAEHQRHLELLLENVRTRYATAQLELRERRERKGRVASEAQFAPHVLQATSGRK